MSSSPARRWLPAFLVAMAIVATTLGATPAGGATAPKGSSATPEATAVQPLPKNGFGVRFGTKPSLIAEYEQWFGRSVAAVTVYFHGDTDAQMLKEATGLIGRYKGSKYNLLIFSMPLVVGGRSLQSVASGSMDSLARQLAQEMVAGGRGDDVVRLGWEFNGKWFKWSAQKDPAAYAAAFRRIVTVMRGVPGGRNIRFEWTISRGGGPVLPASYPGDAYVDIVGLDMYDSTYGTRYTDPLVRWNSYLNDSSGLLFQRDFAKKHNKPMAISEWGLTNRHVPGVVHDNTLFIQKTVEWVKSNNVAYANYFEDDTPWIKHRLMLHFPKAASLYKQLT